MSMSSNQFPAHDHSVLTNLSLHRTNSSTETDKTTDSDATRATTPDTPDTEYSTLDTSAVDDKFDDAILTDNNDKLQQADEFGHLYKYGQFSPSDFDATFLMERLDPNRRYVQMTCGYWYALEDDDEIRPMAKAEYQEFIAWTSQTPVITREDFNKRQQADAEQGIITSNNIAIIESLDDDGDEEQSGNEEADLVEQQNHATTPEE